MITVPLQQENITNVNTAKASVLYKDNVVKERIIVSAFDQFAQYGIKSISMDAIARSIGISKRTIYGYFNDKEELLTEGINYYSLKTRRLSDSVYKRTSSVLEAMLFFHKETMKHPRWYSPRFYDDLQKFPEAKKKLEEEKCNFANECLLLFTRGIKEGVFRNDINFEIISLLAKEQIVMQRPAKIFAAHSSIDIHNTLVLTFLRGISTNKGQEIIDSCFINK